MNDDYLNKRYNNFVIALLLLFPLVINSVKIFGNLIILILVFLGIYVLINEKKSPFKIPEIKLFSWLTFCYFVVMFLSIVQNEGFVDDLYHLGRKAHFLLAPLIALAIFRVKLPLNKLLLSIKVGLIIIGFIVIFQDLSGRYRPSGMYNANIFGDLVLVMTFFSLVNLFEESKFAKLISVISSSLGVYAVILSGNRATFLMLIIISIVYLLIIFQKYLKGKAKEKIIISIACFFIFFSLFQIPSVTEGFNRLESSILMWSDKEDSNTSSGLRLEMWSGSIEAFQQAPWLGHGYRNANNVVSNYVDPKSKKDISGFTHLHNEYITNLVSAGVIGLIALLALLLIPLVIFIQGFKNNSASVYSVMGILLCLSYAGIGITHIAFGEEHMNAFYIFFLAILLPKAIQEKNHSQ